MLINYQCIGRNVGVMIKSTGQSGTGHHSATCDLSESKGEFSVIYLYCTVQVVMG